MKISDIFWDKINFLKTEIRNLKTAHVKTATTISTMERSVSVRFNLKLDLTSGEVYGEQRAIITATTSDDTEMVSACYLEGLAPGGSTDDFRMVEVSRLTPKNGVQRYSVAVTAGSYNDFMALYNGGSVTVSYTLKVVGSSRLALGVDYTAIDGGAE